jgi:hypothetical protein
MLLFDSLSKTVAVTLLSPAMHAHPLRYLFVGAAFIGKEQCLCPFPFLGPMFSPVDNVAKKIFFILGQRYLVFLL